MKKIEMSDCSISTIYSGIYMIVFPNNKKYIGLSNHIYRRMLEHNSDFRNNLPIENAILKYGKITSFYLLEEIEPENRELMREREQYWIQYYHSNDKQFGYNITQGGDGADLGVNNVASKITKEQLDEIYDLLKNRLDITLEQIAQQYNLHLTTISKINNGHTYYSSAEHYPLRNSKDCKYCISGINNRNSKFTEEDLCTIYNLLKQNEPIINIATQFHVDRTTIQNINNGVTYHNKDFIYPLQVATKGKRQYTDEKILAIYEEIRNNPNESLASIGRRLNVPVKAMSHINTGRTYKQPNVTYPIR